MPKKKIAREALYIQIKEEILREIIAGRWAVGSVLPNEFELADEYDVSQGTVRKALNILNDENILIRQQGKGTYVSPSGAMRFFKFQTPSGQSKIESSKRLSVEKIKTPTDIKHHFKTGNTHCFRVERIRILGKDARLYEIMYLPHELFPEIEETPSLNRFLYQHYEAAGNVPIHRAEQCLHAVMPNDDCQKHLNISKDTPVLLQEHIVYNLENNAIEYRQSYCNSHALLYKITHS